MASAPSSPSEIVDLVDRVREMSDLGERMYEWIRELYPICRSITGSGLRETLRRISKRVPELEVHGVASGTHAFDWTVPLEWNIKDAYVKDASGRKIIDFARHNLHVVGYSTPVHARLSLEELRPHLHTLPQHPDWIPYRTSYYNPDWGFCLSENEYRDMPPGRYDVYIDSSLTSGELNYGEWLKEGRTDEEVLLSCHCCHPSLCNDNLSGIAVATYLANFLSRIETRLSYRFLFIPGGIGSVVWMSRNVDTLPRIKHGLTLACLGNDADFTYKQTRHGMAQIDHAVNHILRRKESQYQVIDFSPYGYDERNYCSPRFDLPVGSLTRSTHSSFVGYHTSADDLDLVKPHRLADAVATYLQVVEVLEGNGKYLNLVPEAEPQLGRRGLYGAMGGLQQRAETEMALLWVMNLSDGRHTLLDIAERSGYDFRRIKQACERLLTSGLLREAAAGETVKAQP